MKNKLLIKYNIEAESKDRHGYHCSLWADPLDIQGALDKHMAKIGWTCYDYVVKRYKPVNNYDFAVDYGDENESVN